MGDVTRGDGFGIAAIAGHMTLAGSPALLGRYSYRWISISKGVGEAILVLRLESITEKGEIMNSSKALTWTVFVIIIVACSPMVPRTSAATPGGYDFTTLFDPLALTSTLPRGISGNTIVGSYGDSSGFAHGFIYNGSAFTTLDDPLAPRVQVGDGTFATGISGGTIIGYYYDNVRIAHGFIYNGSTFATLDDPLAGTDPRFGPGTFPQAISGTEIVGYYQDSKNLIHGFTYNGSTFTTLDDPGQPQSPGSGGTLATGVSGGTVVGHYYDGSVGHGFIYNGARYTNLDDPLATNPPAGTFPQGVSGNTIVGSYSDHVGVHGFVYDGSTFTTLDDPLEGAAEELPFPNTVATGVSGSTIIGYYDLAHTGFRRGFIATPAVPPPPVPGPNVLKNGDFALGNIGFTSGYFYNRYLGPTGPVHGLYYVGTDPSLSNSTAPSFGDHTTGSALMMLVNGSTQPNTPVWQQTVGVSPKTLYQFSVWARSWGGSNLDPSPADLQLTINGTPVGTSFQLSSSVDQWVQFTADWNSQGASLAQLSLTDLNTSAIGNDFAIDDLSFASMPEPAGLIAVVASLAGLLVRRRRSGELLSHGARVG